MNEKRTFRNRDVGVVITNASKSCIVCTEGILATTFWTRLIGLLGKTSLKPGAGLLIEPSSGVHTFGMSFPIDIVSLDKNRRVIATFENTRPWTIRGLSRKTRSVLELPVGQIIQCAISAGDQLTIEAH